MQIVLLFLFLLGGAQLEWEESCPAVGLVVLEGRIGGGERSELEIPGWDKVWGTSMSS